MYPVRSYVPISSSFASQFHQLTDCWVSADQADQSVYNSLCYPQILAEDPKIRGAMRGQYSPRKVRESSSQLTSISVE